jgi:hypothetical protein
MVGLILTTLAGFTLHGWKGTVIVGTLYNFQKAAFSSIILEYHRSLRRCKRLINPGKVSAWALVVCVSNQS